MHSHTLVYMCWCLQSVYSHLRVQIGEKLYGTQQHILDDNSFARYGKWATYIKIQNGMVQIESNLHTNIINE